MKKFTIIAALAITIFSLTAQAEETKVADYEITIKNHVFTPAELKVKANTAFTINVKNEDATAEEFESHNLHVEKVIAGGKSAIVRVHPLKTGTYKFFGEFNEKTAQGKIIAE